MILSVFLYNEQQQQSLIKEIKDSELVYLEYEQSVLLRLNLTPQGIRFLLQGNFFLLTTVNDGYPRVLSQSPTSLSPHL